MIELMVIGGILFALAATADAARRDRIVAALATQTDRSGRWFLTDRTALAQAPH